MAQDTGISMAAVQKLVAQLLDKNYMERGAKEGSWRVYLTQ